MNVLPACPFCVFSKFDNHIRRRKKRPTVAPRRPLTFIHHNSFAIYELKMWSILGNFWQLLARNWAGMLFWNFEASSSYSVKVIAFHQSLETFPLFTCLCSCFIALLTARLPFELLPPDLPEENHATSPLLQMTFGIVTDEKRLCKAQLFVTCFI